MPSSYSTPHLRPINKRVRFDDVVSELCQVPSVENKQEVWYSKAEFTAFTKELRLTIRALRKHTGLMSRLEEAFQFSLSLAGNLVDEYDEETALTRIRSHQNMKCWNGNDQRSFRGLECLTSPLIKCHSDLCKEVNARLGDYVKTGKPDEDEVQKLCSTNSRCARIFARLMAECDATSAAGFADNDDEADASSCHTANKRLKTSDGVVKRVLVPTYLKTTNHLVSATPLSLSNSRKRRLE